MKWIKYDLHTTTKDADSIGGILTECGILGYEITDHIPPTEKEEKQMYTDIPADCGEDDGSSVLTFYTEIPDNEEKTFFSTGSSLRDAGMAKTQPVLPPEKLIAQIYEKIRARQKFVPIQMPHIAYCIQDDSLWKDKWKENFKPFRIADDIIVKPTWEDPPKDTRPNDIIIEIDPGSAFGTGTHETTRLCLLTLRKYITPGIHILDAGCGSGILAITALLCGAKSAFCLDIDPAAVDGTLENAKKNHIESDRLTAIRANILEEGKQIKKICNGTFQIAIANILADVIIPLAGQIGSFLCPDGIFISSGILAEKAKDVEKALTDNHFAILEKNTIGDWVAFAAQKQN